MADYSKLLAAIQENVMFLVISVLMIVLVYAVAFGLEKLIEKKYGIRLRAEQFKVRRMVTIAMFSAVAAVLMLFEIPLWFAPGFYKLDFSELPALIGAFMFGPCAGVMIEAVKILLKIVLKGTTTAFVGDFANFLIGCAIVVPASSIYFTRKSKKSAIVGIIAGGIIMTVAGAFLNGFYLLPKFSELYGMPMDILVGMGTKVNPNITSVGTLVAWAVVPFNILKAAVVGVLTTFLYKYVSRLIKGQHVEN